MFLLGLRTSAVCNSTVDVNAWCFYKFRKFCVMFFPWSSQSSTMTYWSYQSHGITEIPVQNFPSKLKVSHAMIPLQLIIKWQLNHREKKETVYGSMMTTQWWLQLTLQRISWSHTGTTATTRGFTFPLCQITLKESGKGLNQTKMDF